jgi:hypothetical protein
VPKFEDLSGDEEKEFLTNALTTGGWSVLGHAMGISPDSLFGGDDSEDIEGVGFNCSQPLIKANVQAKFLFTPEQVYDNSVIEFTSFTFDLDKVDKFQRKIEDLNTMELPSILFPIYYKTLKPKFKKRGFFRHE